VKSEKGGEQKRKHHKKGAKRKSYKYKETKWRKIVLKEMKKKTYGYI